MLRYYYRIGFESRISLNSRIIRADFSRSWERSGRPRVTPRNKLTSSRQQSTDKFFVRRWVRRRKRIRTSATFFLSSPPLSEIKPLSVADPPTTHLMKNYRIATTQACSRNDPGFKSVSSYKARHWGRMTRKTSSLTQWTARLYS